MKEREIKRGEIVIYKAPTGPEIQVKLEKDTVWLSAHLIGRLFGVNRPAIVKHINNIYKNGELNKKSTCSILEQVAVDGKIRKMNLYNLDKIKFATDGPTFEKAVNLYEKGKVTQFEEGISAYSAIVIGTKPYRVSIEERRYDYGHCECYLGQNDTLCKHMVALAIYAVKEGKPLTDEDKRQVSQVTCSNRLGELSKGELSSVKKEITGAMRYIKSYEGPSRIWFSYQNSLSEGCNRLSKIVSGLLVSEQTAKLLVDMLLRLDDKLCRSGVDDSDGTVGGFIEETVQMLKEYTKLDLSCVKAFNDLKGRETCFGWEEPLLELIKN